MEEGLNNKVIKVIQLQVEWEAELRFVRLSSTVIYPKLNDDNLSHHKTF